MSLGILNGNTLRTVGLGASAIPGKCWDKPGFKACHADKWRQARSDCTDTAAIDFNGDVSKCIEVMTDAYVFNDCIPKLCPEEPLRSRPVQVGPIYVTGDPCDSPNTIKFVQTVVGTPADGKWGPLSRAAYDRYVAATGDDWYDIVHGCKGTGPYPRAAVPAPTVPEEAVPPEVPVAPPTTKPGLSRGAVFAGVGVVAALGVGGYYWGQKKGWFG